MTTVAIVGGGITGLTTALKLRRRGHEVVLLESEDRPGGKAKTERRQGYLLEHGPNGWVADREDVTRLVAELGLSQKVIRPGESEKTRYLLLGEGGLLPLPRKPQE